MGRKKSLVQKPTRTAFIQIRCMKDYREGVEALAKLAGHPHVTAFVEALIERERKRLKASPLPPR